MATTSYQDIEGAIMDRLAALWNAATVPIHWPAQPFPPPAALPWLQPRVQFADAEQITLGVNGQNRISGALEATLHSKLGVNAKTALYANADTLKNLFPRGLGLAANGRTLVFAVPKVDLYVEDEDGAALRVVCPFYLDELQP